MLKNKKIIIITFSVTKQEASIRVQSFNICLKYFFLLMYTGKLYFILLVKMDGKYFSLSSLKFNFSGTLYKDTRLKKKPSLCHSVTNIYIYFFFAYFLFDIMIVVIYFRV